MWNILTQVSFKTRKSCRSSWERTSGIGPRLPVFSPSEAEGLSEEDNDELGSGVKSEATVVAFGRKGLEAEGGHEARRTAAAAAAAADCKRRAPNIHNISLQICPDSSS